MSTRSLRGTLVHSLARAFQHLHNENLGQQPYMDYLCWELEQLIEGKSKKLLINLPPRHLKTFLGAICLSAWILAHKPSTKIIIVTCSDNLAQDIAFTIRQIMQSPWYSEFFRQGCTKIVCAFATFRPPKVAASMRPQWKAI